MKIAHISDFHLRHHLTGTSGIARRRSREMPERIAQAVEQIRAESPDLVAVTGDLVDYPLDALNDPDTVVLGEKDLRLVRDLFSPFTCPVAFVYGNHDHPESFRKLFGHLPEEFEVAGHRILLFFDAEAPDHFPERRGRQRERFFAALSDADPRPQIHIQHYLTAPTRNDAYPHTYREADRLKTALLQTPRVRLVLSGHYHTGEPLFNQEHVFFSTVPAFGEPPHPYRIYTLTDTGITQTERQTLPAGPQE